MNRFSSSVQKTASAGKGSTLNSKEPPQKRLRTTVVEEYGGTNHPNPRTNRNASKKEFDDATSNKDPKNDGIEEDDQALLDDPSEIYMALSFSNNVLGLACYHEARNTILLNAYQLSSGDADNVIRMIKQTMSPTLFLLHPNILMNIGLHRLIVKPLEEEEEEEDHDELNTADNISSITGKSRDEDSYSRMIRNRQREYAYKSLKSSSWQEHKLVGYLHDTLQVGHYRKEKPLQQQHPRLSANAIAAMNYNSEERYKSMGAYQSEAQQSSYYQRDMVYTGIDLYNLLTRTVEIDKIQIRQSLVALITYLKESIFQYLLDDRIIINDILPFPDHSYLQMDMNSFRALQIFCEDIHPNWIRGKGKNKEGFSIFALFDRTKSLIGRKKLREWMLKPFVNRDKILSRHVGIDFTIQELNREYVKLISQQLKHFSDISQVLVRIKKAQSSFKDWCKMHTSLIAGTKILHVLLALENAQTIEEESRAFVQGVLSAVDVDVIAALADRLSNVLDFVESERQHRVVIAKGVDEELDNQRMLFDELEDVMFATATEILTVVPILERLKVEYFPQLGYLVAVEDIYAEVLRSEGYIVSEESEDDKVNQDVENNGTMGMIDEVVSMMDGDDYEYYQSVGHTLCSNRNVIPIPEEEKFSFVYSQDNVVYFKHHLVRRLDAEIGDISSDIADRQRAILLGLEEEMVQCELEIVALYHTLAELDAYISLGEMAIEHKLVKPQIVEDSIIAIKGGRHLLQELTVDDFIANDTYVSSDRNIALITGPNASGKSIYLKQVGLITYLAHIGSYVPCEQAIIGLTDRIMTRISSNDSSAIPQSTFTIDLNQISKMLKFLTPRSLCLIDEFGKCTSPIDGMSLLVGILRHFAAWKGNVFCALHFSEVLHEDILGAATMKSVNFFRMETLKEDDGRDIVSSVGGRSVHHDIDDAEEPDSLIPLFKLKHGIERSSEGILCAERMGLKKSIILRAREIKSAIEKKDVIDRLWTPSEVKQLELYEELLNVLNEIHCYYVNEGERLYMAEQTLSRIEQSESEEREDPSEKEEIHRQVSRGHSLLSKAQSLFQQLREL